MKRKPYREGDWFAVPVGSQFILGRVGHRGGILLGYFFKPLQSRVPTIEDTTNLTASDAFNVGKFGDRGLLEDGWPIIPFQGSRNREEWPMPKLGRINFMRPDTGFAVEYDESELSACIGLTPITAEEA